MGIKRKEIEKEIQKITDTVDLDFTNEMLDMSNFESDFELSKQTLKNIAKWALDGKSQNEIMENLELSAKEWTYLVKVCPTILIVMQHSRAYADMVVAGTLYQTAIGGHKVKKKIPMKIKEYNECGKVIAEHVEIIEYDDIAEPNPMLLKYIAEHKLSENFGETKVDTDKEHRKVIDNLTEEDLKIIEAYDSGKD